MKANLLLHLESFTWADLSVDKSYLLDDLAIAIDSINKHGDKIFNEVGVYTTELPWGNLYQLITLDSETKLRLCPWLTKQHQITIGKIFSRSITAKSSRSLSDLNSEFPGGNNAWLGLSPVDLPTYVSNQLSWKNLHRNYIYVTYAAIAKDTAYFHQFYVPKLMTPAGTIKTRLKKKQEHPIFDRLDTPTTVENDTTLHGEQVQIHFTDKGKSALNMNGEWKHGKFDIPNEAKKRLTEWGFKLPS